ncbi:MAG: relaxase domain-containing protein [Verrucomicrobiota bacterium]
MELIERRTAYISRDSEIPNSHWVGGARQQFPLRSSVKESELLNLFKGVSPNGKVALLPNPLKAGSPDGWVIRFTAPKSIRDLWLLAPEKHRIAVEDTHGRALAASLGEFEGILIGSRDAQSASTAPRALLAVVKADPFLMEVPQIEADVFFPNLLLPRKGPAERCPLSNAELKEVSVQLANIYNEVLCEGLHRKLGLDLHREPSKDPQIVGVPEGLEFSRPRFGGHLGKFSWFSKCHEELCFDYWHCQGDRQAWGRDAARELFKYGAMRKSLWTTFEPGLRERNAPRDTDQFRGKTSGQSSKEHHGISCQSQCP